MTLDIDPSQAEVLREVLASQLKELSIEEARTDSHDYHAKLDQRRRTLEDVLAKLDTEWPIDESLANRLS